MTIEQEARAEAEKAFPPPSDRARSTLGQRYAEARLGFEEGFMAGASRPVTDAELGAMAQAFYEATHFPGSGIRYMAMTVKPEIVAGLRAALEAIRPTEGNPT